MARLISRSWIHGILADLGPAFSMRGRRAKGRTRRLVPLGLRLEDLTLLSSGSIITTIAGNGGFGYTGDHGPAAMTELGNPSSIATDSQGDLLIADIDNCVIREVDRTTGVITTVAGNGDQGYSGDGGPATAAELDQPVGVAVDAQGDIFIGDLFDNVVREVYHATGTIATVAGNGIDGYSGDGGPATAAKLQVESIAVDPQGDILIADFLHNRIREVYHATSIIATVAGDGKLGYTGNGGPAVRAKLHDPQTVNVDAQGDIFITEYGKSVVREVNARTGLITAIAGNGTAGYTSRGHE
jgi:hypothetical protein